MLFSPAPAMHASAQDLQYQTAMQNDKLIVTASLKNQGDGRNIGIIAVGYDAGGKPVASKSGKTYIPRNEVGNYQLSLPNAGKIASVKVTVNP
ncbi:hypothetical protein KDJ56_05170 [Brevibacillus composti]|uniref:Uncharacterized protein n=1 Tax=Brevibacillus composti TaxID=2796470 RepID=A0A7T5JPD9_9BACL|nr:hypothetical protein [Brevibacillus composti]QQE75373.1 hypothetical protein JD108_05490 [Brevibacillus composti]QUO42399.1 hypothetical protein KDJ56_05170 [Brevibacillus composti]